MRNLIKFYREFDFVATAISTTSAYKTTAIILTCWIHSAMNNLKVNYSQGDVGSKVQRILRLQISCLYFQQEQTKNLKILRIPSL